MAVTLGGRNNFEISAAQLSTVLEAFSSPSCLLLPWRFLLELEVLSLGTLRGYLRLVLSTVN